MQPLSLTVSANHSTVACVSQQKIDLFDLNLGLLQSKATNFLAPISKFTTNGLAVIDANGALKMYNLDLLLEYQAQVSGSALKSIDSHGSLLGIASSSGEISVVDNRTSKPVLNLLKPNDIARDLKFYHATQIACIYDTGKLLMWDLRSPHTPVWRQPAQQQGFCLDASFQNKLIATGGRDHLVNLWDVSASQPKLIQTFDTPYASSKMQFTSSQTLAVSGRPVSSNSLSSTIAVWRLGSSRLPLYVLEPHSDAVTDLAVYKHFVYSCGRDNKIMKSDLRTQNPFASNFGPSVFPNTRKLDFEVSTSAELVELVYETRDENAKTRCEKIADLLIKFNEFRHADMWSSLALAASTQSLSTQLQPPPPPPQTNFTLNFNFKSNFKFKEPKIDMLEYTLSTSLEALNSAGCDISLACVSLVFPAKSTPELIEQAIYSLERRREFRASTCLRQMANSTPPSSAIITCFKCHEPLETSAAFCLKCKSFRLCALCNQVAFKLCKVIVECGHVVHDHCWDQWGSLKCPLGCI